MKVFAATLALAALCTLAAMPGARAASCVDSDDCADLNVPESCGRTVLGFVVTEVCPVACKAPACAAAIRAARSTSAQISTSEGNVKLQAANGKQVMIVKDDGTEINLSDTLTATEAVPQFKSQERRTESTEGQIKGLLQTLQTTFTAHVDVAGKAYVTAKAQAASNAALVEELALFRDTVANQTQAQASVVAENTGDTSKAGGIPWNTFPFTDKLQDQGGYMLPFTWPKGRELIADSAIKIYQCVFTLLDDKGKATKETRASAMLAATTPRSFLCSVPAWNKAGSLPQKKEWKTAVGVRENGRDMPSPKNAPVMTWTTQTPTMKFPGTSPLFRGGKNKKVFHTIPFTLSYPYGPDGYASLSFSLTTTNKNIVTNIEIIGDKKSASRSLKFAITSDAKLVKLGIDVTVASKTGLKSVVKQQFQFAVSNGLGQGGLSGDYMTEAAVKSIHNRLGYNSEKASESWQLCHGMYKSSGWDAGSKYWNACAGKGQTFFFLRRTNGRVFGGYMKDTLTKSNRGYTRNTPGWLWRVNPSNANSVDYYGKCCAWHVHYFHSSHAFTWGGGHDLHCNTNGGCYANLGYSYSNPRGYHSTNGKKELAGDYSFNMATEIKNGAVVEIYLIK